VNVVVHGDGHHLGRTNSVIRVTYYETLKVGEDRRVENDVGDHESHLVGNDEDVHVHVVHVDRNRVDETRDRHVDDVLEPVDRLAQSVRLEEAIGTQSDHDCDYYDLDSHRNIVDHDVVQESDLDEDDYEPLLNRPEGVVAHPWSSGHDPVGRGRGLECPLLLCARLMLVGLYP